jgi:hypothetical protein
LIGSERSATAPPPAPADDATIPPQALDGQLATAEDECGVDEAERRLRRAALDDVTRLGQALGI